MIGAVFATDEDGAFGYRGDLPWDIKADFQHFKRVTLGAKIVMGKDTWKCLPCKLPCRTTIVLSTTLLKQQSDITVYRTPEEIIDKEGTNFWVIGGVGVLKTFKDLVDYDMIYRTIVFGTHEHDVSIDSGLIINNLSKIGTKYYDTFMIEKFINPVKF